MQDLGALGGRKSVASGINDNGQVVGYFETQSGDSRVWRGFLYTDGVMRDLHDLINKDSGWRLDIARAINDRGQIVGGGRSPSGKYHAFLLNPLPEWRRVIETQPVQPTYSAPPKKENAKDSLVVVTHGWQPWPFPVDIAWVESITNAVSSYLIKQGLNNWQVHAHRWVKGAWKINPDPTLTNAKDEGVQLGLHLASQKLRHIHLIGHSAGSALIQTACEAIKSQSPDTTIHLTFLDPFVGFDEEWRNRYGAKTDWADNYYSRDFKTSPISYQFTEGLLPNAYNVDVTFLDGNKKVIDVSRSAAGTIEYCKATASSHEWPHQFYLRTIIESLPQANGLGFSVSKAGGGFELARGQYAVGNTSPRILGTPDTPCAPSFFVTTPAVLGPVLNFSTPIDKSTTGNILFRENGFEMRTGSPVWLATMPVITNAVNLVSFEAEFLGTGAEGLLTVYWDTEVLASIDERVTAGGVRQYSFLLPAAVGAGQTLGFRLDSFAGTSSAVRVTKVALGHRGLLKPFSLRFNGFDANGAPMLELLGPANFTYAVEASSNLVDWETVALLDNASGTIRFTDSARSGATAKFYRAVVP